ncbi:hypothetical protein GS634_08160 [Ruegeria atlantica]|uniref:Uncharacterized protein n=1 Tax=Ruegeria atlantica TaxID=81569 RepID=A0AA90YZT4_9RHOB|nr:hypothetical protein [Ruegeria atlantica]NOE18096.1 hypothetical protein [Ruegeria atlantica]
MNDRASGQRFSHLYLERSSPKKDSNKARFRLFKLAESIFPRPGASTSVRSSNNRKRIIDMIESELGIRFATKAGSGRLVESWEGYFGRIPIEDLLDTITLMVRLFRKFGQEDRAKQVVTETKRIFAEENLAYEVDGDGGVHPLVDSVFSVTRQTAIAGLNDARYTATAENVERMDACLLQNPPDYIGAIRLVFGACENLFKLMYSVPRLDARSVGDKLAKDQQALYAGHSNLQSASSKTLEGFKDWINAAHFYRHEQGVEEPNQPSEEVAILIISNGLSYVRWLAQLDQTLGYVNRS